MSDNRYESKITKATAPIEAVYAVLSNLENLEKVRNLIPEDKVKDLEITGDMVRFKVDGLGQKVVVRIEEREENKTVKFALDNLPVKANFWIQTKGMADDDTRLKLTLGADLPIMFRMMLEKKLQDGLDQAADMLARLPYTQWSSNV